MKYFCSSFLNIEDAIIADCEADIPGKKPAMLDIPKQENNVLNVVFLFMFMLFVIICFGILFSFFILKSKVLVPNNPDSIGNSGWFMWFEFSTRIPRIAANRITVNVTKSFFLSFSVKRITDKIKR